MTNEYANAKACRAAGVEPVPMVGDEALVLCGEDDRESGPYAVDSTNYRNGHLVFTGGDGIWRTDRCRLIRRGDTVIERGGEG